MIVNHIHHALAQVRELQHTLIERQRFRGYSGPARAAAGTVALAAAIILGSAEFPRTTTAHLWGWGCVFALALAMNCVASLYWFLRDPQVNREWRKLRPTLDVFPPLIVGGVLSLGLIWRGHHDFLPGAWMCLYGLANLASRHVLPKAMGLVGGLYVAGGAACLLLPGFVFTNPWPMGVMFFVGELAGGLILYLDRTRKI